MVDERFQNQLARRLSLAESELATNWVDWPALRKGLAACDSWPAIFNFLAYLIEALRGLDKPFELAKGAIKKDFPIFQLETSRGYDIPIFEYAKEVIERTSPTADLEISQADLVEEESCGMIVRRLRDDLTIHHAFAWMQEALLSWEPWKPRVDSELFDIEFARGWLFNELSGQPPPFDVEAEVHRLISDSPGYALAVLYERRKALVVGFGQLRSSWTKMTYESSDFVIMPIAPKAADWIICYFHHDYLELGRRVGDWPHKISVNI